jgi:hypothetical protein
MKKLFLLALAVLAIGLVACSNPSSSGSSKKSSGITVNAKWFVQKDAPGTGSNGDLWLDPSTTILYVNVNGTWTTVATLKGSNGTNGSGWTVGAAPPAAGVGSDGDLWLDSTSTIAYQKISGTWTALFTLKGTNGTNGTNGSNGTNGTNGANGTNGTNGTNGAMWWTGSSVPTSSNPSGAVAGDLYLDTATAQIYTKLSNGGWNAGVSFQSLSAPQYIFTPYMPRGIGINAVAYGNGIFVGVGDYGNIIRTTDGTNWTWVAFDGERQIFFGMDGDSVYINSDYDGSIYYTTDGSTPTYPQSGTTLSYIEVGAPKVVSGNPPLTVKAILVVDNSVASPVYSGTFVYMNDLGIPRPGTHVGHTVFGTSKSRTGETNNAKLPIMSGLKILKGQKGLVDADATYEVTPYSLNGIAYGNNIFVAVGEYGTIIRSTDGISWTYANVIHTDIDFTNVAYGNGYFVAYSGAQIWSSPDGQNWKSVNGAPNTTGNQTIAYLKDKWTLFASTGIGGTGLAIYSTSDVSSTSDVAFGWAGLTASATFSFQCEIYGAAYGNGMYVAVGYRNGMYSPLILTSGDGTTWSTQDLPINNGYYYPLFGIAYGTGGFIAVSGYSYYSGSSVLTSSNGKSWAIQAWNGGSGTSSFSSVAGGTLENEPFYVIGLRRGDSRG